MGGYSSLGNGSCCHSNFLWPFERKKISTFFSNFEFNFEQNLVGKSFFEFCSEKKFELVSKEMFFIHFSRSRFNLAEEKTRKVAKRKKDLTKEASKLDRLQNEK